MAAVDVESLTITYGKVTAVDDLSFRAEAGEVTCVLGPNGAGKTSTVEALEGLRRPASGRMSVVGLDPRADHRALTRRMGVMLQEGGIHPAVRVREALRHAAALYRNPLDPRALVERLGLTGLEGRPCRHLSGGEQRRVALALALVGRPQVAFLDEPTAGVDPAGRQVIRQVIADLRGEGVTVLLTTHDLDEAERVADRVVIVVAGRLVAAGTVEELTRTSGADANVRFRAAAGLDTGALSGHLGGPEVHEVAPGDYLVAAAPIPSVVAAITGWLAEHEQPLADLRAGRQRLEDIYLRLTAGGPAARHDAGDPARPAESTPPGSAPSADMHEPGAEEAPRSAEPAPAGVTEAGPESEPAGVTEAGPESEPAGATQAGPEPAPAGATEAGPEPEPEAARPSVPSAAPEPTSVTDAPGEDRPGAVPVASDVPRTGENAEPPAEGTGRADDDTPDTDADAAGTSDGSRGHDTEGDHGRPGDDGGVA
jgi:ABC-2 type transport system ATP-binding protein